MKLIAIDPGINSGIIIFDLFFKKIIFSDTFKAIDFNNQTERLFFYGRYFSKILLHYKPDIGLMEDTAFWESSAISRVSASSGSLILLSHLAGIFHYTFALNGIIPIIIKPLAWKGNLPLQIVMERNEKFFKCKFSSPHVHSALGLIKWYLEKGIKNENNH